MWIRCRYLDIINIFIYILQIFSNAEDRSSFVCYTFVAIMPPKGDSVKEGELYLSNAVSELKIIAQKDCMCVYEEKPARQYDVGISFLFYNLCRLKL